MKWVEIVAQVTKPTELKVRKHHFLCCLEMVVFETYLTRVFSLILVNQVHQEESAERILMQEITNTLMN